MDIPFNFNSAKPAIVRGSVSKNFPPTANKIASRISPTIINSLSPLENFFEEILLLSFFL